MTVVETVARMDSDMIYDYQHVMPVCSGLNRNQK